MPTVPSFFGLSTTEASSGAGVKNVGIFQKKVLPPHYGLWGEIPPAHGVVAQAVR